jgi:hypothetical protein
VALKTSPLNSLKQRFLTLLVSDWKDMTTFTPGLKGGQRYLINKQSKTEDKEMTASTIKKLFSEIKCFLLPKYSAETDVAYKQQMSALLRLVLEQEPSIQTDEDDNAIKLIRNILESLNALSTYTDIDEAELEWLAEPNASYEDEENDIKETESASEDPDSQSTVESASFFGKPSAELEEDFFQLGDNNFSMEDEAVGVPSVEVDFWADLDGFGGSSEFEGLSDGSNRQANEKDAGEKMSVKEFLAKQKLSDQKGKPTETTTNEECIITPEKTSDENPSALEIINGILSKTDPLKMYGERLKNLKLSSIDFSQVVCVPEEFTKKPIQKPTSMYENAFGSESQVKHRSPSTLSSDSRDSLVNCSSLASPAEGHVAFDNLQQKASVEDPIISALLEKLILIFDETGMDHFDSVDEMFSKALLLAKNEGHANESSTVEGQIKAQLIQAFHYINAYVESMDEVFEQKIFVNEPEELSADSKKIKINLLNIYGNKLGRFLDVTGKKIADAEDAYRKLNDQITEEEATNIEFTQNLAVKLYQERVRIDDISSQDELLRLHGKWGKIATDACVNAYCGDNGNKSILKQPLLHLEKKLVDLHEQNKMQLKERLETNKIRTILMKSIASRYESELDRSAVRNPAISTTEQFDDMSNNYRHEAKRKFEESLKPLASFEAKEELRKLMDSELNKVFRAKQEEFNKKKKVTSSPGYSSATTSDEMMDVEEESENAQSQPQIPAQVGIHFGFDFLSAVALVDGSPRTVYGPSPNTISFDPQNDSFIGETRSSSAKETLSFSRIFKNLDMSTRYYVYYGKYCRIEELVALVLAHLHRAVGRSLHTNNIGYVIAFPSCFNQPARRAMNYAVQIAGLNAKMVRNTCGLTAYFIKDLYEPVFANSFQHLVLTIVENESDESSDLIGYEISNQVVSPVFLCGFYPPSWSLSTPLTVRSGSKPGLTPLVEKIQNNPFYMTYNKSAIRVILHCSGSNQERNMNIIKAAMPGVKVHFYPSNTINTKSNLTVGKGAALLAGYKFNPKFSQDWDRDHPEITLRGFDQDICNTNNRKYRMVHYGHEIGAHQVSELSQKVQSQVAAYHRSLEKEKSRGKTVYMEKSNQIQDSNMKQSDKNRASRDLSALLKDMDEEELSLSRVRDIMYRIENF